MLPLLATQILWINLITDSGPALAMGVDPQTEDVMARPPRRPGERAIDARMAWGVVWIGLAMALATLLTIDLYLPGGLIAGDDDLATARTAGFTVLVLAQLFNCFNARSETASAFRSLFVNRWLWGAIALSALLQVAVVHLQPLNLAFGTVPLSLQQWASAWPWAAACCGSASCAKRCFVPHGARPVLLHDGRRFRRRQRGPQAVVDCRARLRIGQRPSRLIRRLAALKRSTKPRCARMGLSTCLLAALPACFRTCRFGDERR